jgi:hypothetical protein
MSNKIVQPIWVVALTHDEVIALAGSLDLLRETLLQQGALSLRDLTTVKNIESIAGKMPEEEWFEEVAR